MKASTTDWKQSVEDAKSAVLIWALKEKTEAVKNALLVAEQQKNKELEALKNKHLIVLTRVEDKCSDSAGSCGATVSEENGG